MFNVLQYTQRSRCNARRLAQRIYTKRDFYIAIFIDLYYVFSEIFSSKYLVTLASGLIRRQFCMFSRNFHRLFTVFLCNFSPHALMTRCQMNLPVSWVDPRRNPFGVINKICFAIEILTLFPIIWQW